MKRVGIAGFLHESNTFLLVPTTYGDFANTTLTRDADLVRRWSGSHHELGGFLAAMEEHRLDPSPLMATYAVPSGAIARDVFERLIADMVACLQAAMPLDGVLLALHGATVAEGFPDADGEITRRFREVLGPRIPLIVTLDLHANVSAAMVEHTNATVMYRSNPHLDQRERGREAAALMMRTLGGTLHPVQALETPPLLINIAQQYTSEYPAKMLYDDVEIILRWPGIVSASVAMGFYFADVEAMGASFLAVADGDPALARKAARWMARRAWERRSEFAAKLPDSRDAVGQAAKSVKRPVVLMDVGDNVGGGSPGDSTILFAEVLRQRVPNALVLLHDPGAVRACVEVGVRQTVDLHVGAKTGPGHGTPVRIRGRVRTLSDGLFVETAVRHGGWGQNDQGITAVVETEEEHSVVLTSRRMAPMSLEQLLSLGIKPGRKNILIVKGVVAPRAAYEPIAGEILLVDTPGCTSANPFNFDYLHRRRPLYPLELDAEYK